MDTLTEVADRYGLTSPQQIGAVVHRLPPGQVSKLFDDTVEAILSDEGEPNPLPHDEHFVASSSFRGDSGCREWGCREEKLAGLAQFAALYSDGVIVPHFFDNFKGDDESSRTAIGDFFFKLWALRPLVEAGLARFAVDRFCLCSSCHVEFRRATLKHDREAFDFFISKLPELQLVYRPPSPNSPWVLELSGPADLVPHGHLLMVPECGTRPPSWAPIRVQKVDERPGVVIAPSRVRKHKIGVNLFSRLAKDATFQQYHGVKHQARYVTDSSLEAEFLESVYPRRDLDTNVRALLSALNARLPVLTDLPLATVLKIRKNDYESFRLYRSALREVIAKHVKPNQVMSVREASQVYEDVIAPQLTKLELDVKAKRRSITKRSMAKTVVPVAMLSLGVISGLVPQELAEIFKWGGIALSGQIAEALASIEKHPSELRSHNFYFLYRLSAASKKV